MVPGNHVVETTSIPIGNMHSDDGDAPNRTPRSISRSLNRFSHFFFFTPLQFSRLARASGQSCLVSYFDMSECVYCIFLTHRHSPSYGDKPAENNRMFGSFANSLNFDKGVQQIQQQKQKTSVPMCQSQAPRERRRVPPRS